MLSPKSFLGVALFALVLWTRPGVADVVNSAPESCPPGGTPGTCHGGPHCSLDAECTSCPAGEECVVRRLCVGRVGCAGMLAPGEDPSQYDRDTVERECAADESNACCQEHRVCVAEGSGNQGTAGSMATGSAGSASTGSNLQPVTAPSGSCAVSLAPRETSRATLLWLSCGLLSRYPSSTDRNATWAPPARRRIAPYPCGAECWGNSQYGATTPPTD